MGSFLNMNQVKAIEKVQEGYKKVYDNNMYSFLQNPTICTYYQINVDLTTTDEGNNKVYTDAGEQSPVRRNKINNAILFNFSKVTQDSELGDFGKTSGEISGTVTIPMYFNVYEDDVFVINHYNEMYVYKITKVNSGTPEVESVYSADYIYYGNDISDFEKTVVEEYDLVQPNNGSNVRAVIKKKDLSTIETLGDIYDNLKEMYDSLFYDNGVEAYIFRNDQLQNCYDPCMTEFIMRNHLMSSDTNYKYISQQMRLDQEFIMIYNNSIYAMIENKNKNRMSACYIDTYYDLINDIFSILNMRQEPYLGVYYTHKGQLPYVKDIDSHYIKLGEKVKYNDTSINSMESIIVNYMYNKKISSVEISFLQQLEYKNSSYMFYMVPLILYILKYNANLLINNNNKEMNEYANFY